MSISCAQIVEWCQATMEGPERSFSGMEAMGRAGPEELTFAGKAFYAKELKESKAGGALVTTGLQVERRPEQTILWVANADLAVAQVLEKIAPPLPLPAIGVHPTAVIDPSVKLGAAVRIGPHVVIQAGAVIGDRCVLMALDFVGAETTLGEDCFLWPNVAVRERCVLGKRVLLHPGVVIGADGFGYRFFNGRHIKIPQIGTVEIGDDCELGANTAVDRGKFSATRIGAGSKLDNLVQIAHNVRLGQHCILAGQSGIAGSTETDDYLVMGGASVIGDHVKIGAGVQLAAMSALGVDTPDGSKMMGTPAVPAREYFADVKARRHVPKLIETVRSLEQRIANLESAAKNDRS